MTDRRFNEAEVAAIFERASEAATPSPHPLRLGEGMTLAEVQAIGREVGISPEQLARAAKEIELAGQPTSRRFLGFPVGVGLTVDLDRKVSDEEWERIVVDLRETFDARGTVTHEGSLRQWANGNLQALLEPSGTGHRIRLQTIKGDARGNLAMSLAMAGFGSVLLVIGAMAGALDDGLGFLAGSGALGGTIVFGSVALRLPSWARLRRRQMKEVAARVAVGKSLPPATGRTKAD